MRGVCVFEDGVHLAEGAQGLFDHQQYSQLLFPVEKGRPSRWLAGAPQSLSLSRSPIFYYLPHLNQYLHQRARRRWPHSLKLFAQRWVCTANGGLRRLLQ